MRAYTAYLTSRVLSENLTILVKQIIMIFVLDFTRLNVMLSFVSFVLELGCATFGHKRLVHVPFAREHISPNGAISGLSAVWALDLDPLYVSVVHFKV